MAVCGYYACIDGDSVYVQEAHTSYYWCNNKDNCLNDRVDEKYCPDEEEMFWCGDSYESESHSIGKSKVCNGKCDSFHCDDEWKCGGYNYHYWHTC